MPRPKPGKIDARNAALADPEGGALAEELLPPVGKAAE